VVVLSSLVFYFVDHIGWLQEALGGKDLKFLKVFLTPVYPDIPDLTGSGSQVGGAAAPVEEGDENIPYHFANIGDLFVDKGLSKFGRRNACHIVGTFIG